LPAPFSDFRGASLNIDDAAPFKVEMVDQRESTKKILDDHRGSLNQEPPPPLSQLLQYTSTVQIESDLKLVERTSKEGRIGSKAGVKDI